jgi:hypothetical protein
MPAWAQWFSCSECVLSTSLAAPDQTAVNAFPRGGGGGRVCDACIFQLDLSDGPESLTVQSTDALGLVEVHPVTRSFTVDTVPPILGVAFGTPSPGRDNVVQVRLSCTGEDRDRVCVPVQVVQRVIRWCASVGAPHCMAVELGSHR